MGVEPPSRFRLCSFRRDGRVRRDLHLWYHEHLDGAVRCEPWKRVHRQAGPAYLDCRYVSRYNEAELTAGSGLPV